MGGAIWLDNGDGTFTRQRDNDPIAEGLSALDLYVMGMISPSEVPETFLLRDVQGRTPGTPYGHQGTGSH